MPPMPPTHTKAATSKWWILAAVSLTLFLGSVDGSIVNVALPTLMARLQTDLPTVQWVILAYLLGLTVLMVSAGRLADITGKRLILVSGLVLFLLGSVLCSLAPGIYWLIGFRFLQSIGAAMMLAVGVAIVTETWPGTERGKAIGITSGVISMGIVVGPAIGGVLLQWFSWHWIFLVNVPLGLLALTLIARYVPPLRSRRRHERFDMLGGVILGAGLLALTLALTLGQNLGFSTPVVPVLFGLAALAVPLFIRTERRVAFPTVDLSLFRSVQFSLNLATGWIAFAAIAGIVFLLPFYLELVLGFALLGVGLMMAAVPIAMGVLQPFTGTLSDRVGTRAVSLAGLVVIACGYLAMATLRVDGTPWGFVLRLLPVAVGMAIFHSPNNSAVMGAAPDDRLGVASGILSMTRTLGQVAGIAVLGAFFNMRLMHHAGAQVNIRAADPAVIVAALHDQFLLVAALVGVGIGLSVWAWRQEARRAQTTETRGQTPAQSNGYASRSSYDSSTGS